MCHWILDFRKLSFCDSAICCVLTLRCVIQSGVHYFANISAKFFHSDRIRFCKSLNPFSRAFVQNRFLSRRHTLIFILNCMAHFYVFGTRQDFPPQIKCISFAVTKNEIICKIILAYRINQPSRWVRVKEERKKSLGTAPFSFLFLLVFIKKLITKAVI